MFSESEGRRGGREVPNQFSRTNPDTGKRQISGDARQYIAWGDAARVAVIDVKGAGRADVVQDLKAKGFQTADMTLAGTAEFDLTSGTAGVQHYTAHTQWSTHVLWVHLGLIFDDTYDAAPWSVATK